MKKKVSYLLVFSCTAVLIFLFLKKVNISDIKDGLAEVNLFFAALSGLLMLISGWFKSLRWLMLLQYFQPKLTPKLPFLALLISYASNMIIPHAGVVTRSSFLKRKANVPLVENLGTFFAEKLVDSVVIFSLTFMLILNELNEFISFTASDIFQLLGNLLILILGFLLVYQLVNWLLPNATQEKFSTFITTNSTKIKEGILSIRKLKNPKLFYFYTALTWLFNFASFYAAFLAFTTKVSFTTAVDIACVGNLSWIFPAQGGVGAFHLAVSKTMIMKGFEEGLSNFSSIFVHGTITFFDLLFGLSAYVYSLTLKDEADLS